MIRQLLLALFLIGLSLPSVALPAQADTAMADCHGAIPVDGPRHHQPDADKDKAAGHFCIGCVANARDTIVSAPVPMSALSPLARPMPALAGANAPPSTPPPRT